MSVLTNDNRFEEAANAVVEGDEVNNMCDVLDRVEKRGELRGEKRGELRGEKKGELRGEKKGELKKAKEISRNMKTRGLSRVCQVKCVSLYFSLPAVFRAAGFVCQNQYCSYLRMRACILSSIASWLRTNAQLATGRPFHFLYSSTIRR